MAITKKTNHVEEGLALLISEYKDSMDLKSLIEGFLEQIQDIENMWFEINEGRKFANIVGAQVDGYASILDEARQGRTDAIYKLGIAAKKKLINCHGATDELIDLVLAYIGTYSLVDTHSTVTLDRLRLANNTTIPAGNRVRIGPAGDMFETLVEVSNIATGYVQILSTTAQSVDIGPVIGLAGTINEIVDAESGWSSYSVSQSITEPYGLANGDTLTLKIDGGATETFTFLTADFLDINNATAVEVASVIQATIISAYVDEMNSKVWIETNTNKTGSVQITGGTGNGVLQFPTDLITGMNSQNAVLGLYATELTVKETFPATFVIEMENSITPSGADPLRIAAALKSGTLGGVQTIFEYHGDEPVKQFDTVGKGFDLGKFGGAT